MDERKKAAAETHRAIGRFVSEFSQAEYAIRHFLAEEINLSDRFFDAVVGSYDVALLCSVAKAVFAMERDQESATTIDGLLSQFRRLNDERNRVAHGLWVASKDGGTVHHTGRSKLTSQAHVEQAVTLDRLADEASDLRARLERAFMGG